MTRSFSTFALGSYLCASAGCFEQAPSIGDGGSSDGSGSASEESATGSSMSNGSSGSPTSSPDGSGSESDSTGECPDGDCMPSSGETIWTVVQDEAFNIGIYTVVVTGEGDIVAGGAVLDENEVPRPWLGRYAPDGTLSWTETSVAAGGRAHYRGLIALDDGRVVGVGGVVTGGELDDAWLRAVDADGEVVWQHELQTGSSTTYLLGVAPRSGGGLMAVGSASDTEGTRPFVATFEPMQDGWQQGVHSEDSQEYVGTYGTMFSLVSRGNEFVVVGFTQQVSDGPSDAAVWRIDDNGYSIPPVATFGGEGDQDFVDIVDDGGVLHVLGRTGMGDVSAVRLARLGVGDSIVLEWEKTWSDLPFNVGNGLAVSGGVRYVAASTNMGQDSDGFDTRVLRWDGEENMPRWAMPFADPSPGLDYAADVAVAPDGTIVAVGPVTPAGGNVDGWIRKLAP